MGGGSQVTLTMVGEMETALKFVGIANGTKQIKLVNNKHILLCQLCCIRVCILTIFISSLRDNSIRTFTHFCIGRYIDGISCVFLEIS